jgi:hypothetical protein
MPEEESIFDLSRERLDLIDHDVYKWVCCAEGCKGYTRIRDYGEDPMYWGRFKKPWFHKDRWYYLCSRHNAMEKKKIAFPLKANIYAVANMVFEKSVTTTINREQ